jgi:hypothetical protein
MSHGLDPAEAIDNRQSSLLAICAFDCHLLYHLTFHQKNE